jgi:large subunit ribosomal protein L23
MPKQIHPYEVLRRPIVTEKSTALSGHNKYVFEVAKGATKPQVKEAVERAYEDVVVASVNTTTMRGRRKKNRFGRPTGEAPTWKKAIVTLSQGTIEVFEGV